MIGFVVNKFIDETAKVTESVHKASMRALAKAAFAIFKTAQSSIDQSPEAAKPGQPPHTRQGRLKQAIRYDVDNSAECAVIGPRFSMVGTSGEAHEFGGEYMGEHFPERRFMGPALESNRDLIPAFWQGEVTN